MLIVVLGRPGSGKTTVAKKVSELAVLPFLETSEFVKKLAGVKDSRKDWNQVHNFVDKDDPDWLWNPIHEALTTHQGNCVFSGIREPYLLHKIFDTFDDVFVMGVEASEFNRYSRLCTRDGYMTADHFYERNAGDEQKGLNIALSRCDVVIDSNKTLTETFRQIEKEVFKLRKPRRK